MSLWLAIPLSVLLVAGGAVVILGTCGLSFWLGFKGMDVIDKRFGDGTADKIGDWFTVVALTFVAVMAVAAVARWLAT